MNPLTQVKNLQKINAREVDAGFSGGASWHMNYKDSAYIFAGGLDFKLSEGDLLAVFAQYGEIVDVNLVRDRATGDSKGFAFLAYEDQRSTVLAVDNLNGAKVGGRIIRVDHVMNYRKKKEEDEEERQRKREQNGVCYDFQRGHCSRGDSCKYSHDEKRNENTGWGQDDEKKWKHDQFRGGERDRGEFKRPIDRDRDDGKRGRDDRKRSRDGAEGPIKRYKDADSDEKSVRRDRDDIRKSDVDRDRDDFGRSKYDDRRHKRDDEKEGRRSSFRDDDRKSSESRRGARDDRRREDDKKERY